MKTRSRQVDPPVSPPPDEADLAASKRLVHELNTLRAELQSRNEELRRTQAELCQSEMCFRRVIAEIPVGYFFIDQKGCFQHVNDAWLRMHGYDSPDEVIGRHFSITQVENDIEAANRHVANLLSGHPVLADEFSRLRTDGTVGYHTFTAHPVEHNGKVIGLEGFIIDTTERKKAVEQLLQSQKMEAIGQLVDGVAHDFNHILMVIMGHGVSLLRDMTLDDQQQEKVTQIINASEMAAQLTSRLLAFSRKEVENFRAADINDIIQDVHTFLVRVIGDDIQLKMILGNQHLFVNVDKIQIEQILINLVTNARDAMPEGGVVTIETGFLDIDEAFILTNGYGKPGRFVRIAVSDTGVGMDTATVNRIFEPFFTTKETDKGTGLGMSIVHGIIKHNNGFINVSSEPGRGTTFRLYLPSWERQQTTNGQDAETALRL